MTQTFDEELKRALDSLSERLRAHLTEHVNAVAEQLTSVAESERRALTETAANERRAALELADAERQKALEAAEDERRRAVEAAVAEGQAALAAAVSERQAAFDAAAAEHKKALVALESERLDALERAEANKVAALDEAANERRAALEQAAAESRTAIEQAAAAATAAATAEVTARLNESFASREERIRESARREGHDAGVHQARSEAAKIQEERDAQARSALDSANRAAELAAVQAAAARAEATLDAESRLLQRMLDAVRALDGAASLSHALDALSSAVKPEADRTALFLMRGGVLRAWSQNGFEQLTETTATHGIALADAGALTAAVKGGSAQRVLPHESGRPTFAGSATNAVFVAAPVLMNGEVVAVICGDQLSPTDEGKRLAAMFEILARHAARVLESVTALRLAHVSARSATPAPV